MNVNINAKKIGTAVTGENVIYINQSTTTAAVNEQRLLAEFQRLVEERQQQMPSALQTQAQEIASPAATPAERKSKVAAFLESAKTYFDPTADIIVTAAKLLKAFSG